MAAGGQKQQLDHYHEAASSSSSSKATAGTNHGHQQKLAVQQGPAQLLPARNHVVQMQGNDLELAGRGPAAQANKDEDEDEDDDLDSEALLYKLMQQQSFLMNPNFQEEPRLSQAAETTSSQQQQQQQQRPAMADGAGQGQLNDDDLARSKRVIKLLKSYSHIHQVDDTDDQIRGSYTRYARPQSLHRLNGQHR